MSVDPVLIAWAVGVPVTAIIMRGMFSDEHPTFGYVAALALCSLLWPAYWIIVAVLCLRGDDQ